MFHILYKIIRKCLTLQNPTANPCLVALDSKGSWGIMHYPGPVDEAQSELQINQIITLPSPASVKSRSQPDNLVQCYLATFRNVQRETDGLGGDCRWHLPAFLNPSAVWRLKCLQCTDTVPRQQQHACFLKYHRLWLVMSFERILLISEFKINQWLQACGGGGGREGPLSLDHDEVKVSWDKCRLIIQWFC